MLYITLLMVVVAFLAGSHFGEARKQNEIDMLVEFHKKDIVVLVESQVDMINDAIALQDKVDEFVDQINAMNAVFADMMEGYESISSPINNIRDISNN